MDRAAWARELTTGPSCVGVELGLIEREEATGDDLAHPKSNGRERRVRKGARGLKLPVLREPQRREGRIIERARAREEASPDRFSLARGGEPLRPGLGHADVGRGGGRNNPVGEIESLPVCFYAWSTMPTNGKRKPKRKCPPKPKQ